MTKVSEGDSWQALRKQQADLLASGITISDLLDRDAQRCEQLNLHSAGILADFSKHLLDGTSLELLHRLAHEQSLPAAIKALFDGEPVNTTENRPAMHMALRGHRPAGMPEVTQTVADTLQRMQQFVDDVQSGRWTGSSGRPVTTIINIGIGGSDLGPAMVCEALGAFHHPRLRCLFVSNVDPQHMRSTLEGLDAGSTLFIVASKSFTTLETLNNAQLARQWYLAQGGSEQDIHRHFVAVSSNIIAASEFGIDPQNIFPMWDWVGGRFSLWSAIGLSIALATSMTVFRELLAGAAEMDSHFQHTPLEHNLPVRMALLDVWYRNIWRCDSHVVLPYSQHLHLLPDFLQQLEMESLGKSVSVDGSALTRPSGAVIWGSAGTNGQHSFHQMLHQGSRMIPADFILVARPATADPISEQDKLQHQHLLANGLAQSRALMAGKSQQEALQENLSKGMTPERAQALAPHRQVPGNRPSTTLILDELSAGRLGALIALYEHKVFALSVLWGVNAFDQWGVELGKELSGPMFQALNQQPDAIAALDPSSQWLVTQLNSLRKQT